MKRTKMFIFIMLCVGLLGSLALAGQHDYADFPLHNWVMIGFPVTPVDQSPDAVWGPFFGGNQGGDDNATNDLWRFSRWLTEYDTYIRWGELDRDTLNNLSDIGEPTAIIPGWGYWFYQNQFSDVTFNVNGTEADDSGPYYIPIDPPQNGHRGRTMVGNPFTFPIDWNNTDVMIYSELDGIDMTVTLLEANEMGLIDQHAYPWNAGLMNGETNTYIPLNATDGGALPKWQGWWVEQLNDGVQNLITYKVEHTGGDNVCKFHNAIYGRIGQQDDLGQDGVPETDRFIMLVLNPETVIKAETKGPSGTSNEGEFTWPTATSFTNDKGFTIELIDMVDNGDDTYTYTFDVTATCDPELGWAQIPNMSMEHVLFTFGSDKKVTDVLWPSAPNHGNNEDPYIPWSQSGNGNAASYTALRTIQNTLGQATDIALTLSVPPTNASLGKKARKYTPADVIMTTSERDWVMPISVANQAGTVKDQFNAVGILSNASDGYDVFDVAQQNPPDSYLEVYFPHNDKSDLYHYWYERPVSVCYDMRSDSSHKEWKMTVAAYLVANQAAVLSWDASQISAEWALRLQDKDLNVLVEDMKAVSEYSFNTPDLSYSTEIYYISADFLPAMLGIHEAPLAESYALLQNYPNPFNPTTTIQYRITRNEWVQLAIYNLQGELVKTLWSGDQTVGNYQLQWNGMDDNGRPVASGVYLTKLQTPTMTSSNKMLFLK